MKISETRAELLRRSAQMKARYEEAMRGRMVPTAKALRLAQKMKEIDNVLADIDRAAAERIALEKAPIDEVLKIVALPLMADIMGQLVADVDGLLRRQGCQETVFGDYTRQIRRASLAMVDTLAGADESLPQLLDVDETLVQAVMKKIMSFIRQRIKIST